MKLTGKAIKEFEKWFEENIYQDVECDNIVRLELTEAFYTQPNSMKYGVYKAFFATKVIFIREPYPGTGPLQLLHCYKIQVFDELIENGEMYREIEDLMCAAVEDCGKIFNSRK